MSRAEYDRKRERAAAARQEAKVLRGWSKDAANRYGEIKILNAPVPHHIANRITDALATWADEYDQIADALEREMDEMLGGGSR